MLGLADVAVATACVFVCKPADTSTGKHKGSRRGARVFMQATPTLVKQSCVPLSKQRQRSCPTQHMLALLQQTRLSSAVAQRLPGATPRKTPHDRTTRCAFFFSDHSLPVEREYTENDCFPTRDSCVRCMPTFQGVGQLLWCRRVQSLQLPRTVASLICEQDGARRRCSCEPWRGRP